MLRILTFFAGLWFALNLQAAAIKLDTMKVGERVYTNVTITSFLATDVYFSHSKGVANAKIRNLEPSVQKLLDYNPTAAQTAEQQQDQADRRDEAALATAIASRPKTTPGAGEGPEHFADPISDRSLLGKPGPALTFDKWLSDRPDYEGKFVLVSFWSTKSAVSRKWIPQFNAWQKKFKEKLQIIAVTSDSENDVLDLPNPRIEFASALDAKGRLVNVLGLTSVPSILLLDSKGTVLYYGHPAALNEAQLLAALARPVE